MPASTSDAGRSSTGSARRSTGGSRHRVWPAALRPLPVQPKSVRMHSLERKRDFHARAACSAISSRAAAGSRSLCQLRFPLSVFENRLATVRIDAASSSVMVPSPGVAIVCEGVKPRRARAGLPEPAGWAALVAGDDLAGEPSISARPAAGRSSSTDAASSPRTSWRPVPDPAALTCSLVLPPNNSSCASTSRHSFPETASG